jgi:predicted site-specific integrase-resolvase
MTQLRVVAYARVSSKEQADKELKNKKAKS